MSTMVDVEDGGRSLPAEVPAPSLVAPWGEVVPVAVAWSVASSGRWPGGGG